MLFKNITSNIFNMRIMKKLSYCVMLAVMLVSMVVGCSKNEGDDAASLLRTVPADAASVALVNLSHAVERLGGSTDGKTIKLSKDLQKAIDESQSVKEEDKKNFKAICDGESGVAITSVVWFSAARSYFTGLLNDPEKFIAFVKKDNPGMPVQEVGNAKVVGPVAVIGNQFWICQTGTPDVDQLNYYQSLNEKQSYVSAYAASLLLNADQSLNFVADVNRSLGMLPDFIPNVQQVRLASTLLFDDMVYFAGYADIKDGSLLASAMMLNSDMKPAEFLLPTDKIDVSVVRALEGSGNIFAAVAVPSKLTKKITDMLSSSVGKGAAQMIAPLSSIDGTVAVRGGAGIEARIQTNGKDFADLSAMLRNFSGLFMGNKEATVTRDGDIVTASIGDQAFTGGITSEQAASKLKGAWLGVVSDGFIARDMTVASARLVPDKKSLRIDLEIEGGVEAFLTGLLK